MKLVERKVLLNPGPATTSDSVKRALVIPDVCPREAEFCALYAEVRDRLARLAGDPAEVVAVPLAGSGTAAVEAALVSLVPAEGLLLVVDNGDYGARLAEAAAAHGLPHEVVDVGWGRPILPGQVEDALARRKGRVSHLAFVHHETSTGMLNPLPALLAAARRQGAAVIVDAMSSFGVLPVPVGRGGVDVLVASANKCLQGMAGLAFVIAGRALFEGGRPAPRRSLYFDLAAELAHLERSGQARFTVPPQVVSALRQALLELEAEGGPPARRARHARCMDALARGVRALGFQPLLAEEDQGGLLLALRAPAAPWFDFERMHDALYAQGFTVYPGKAGRAPNFRLAVLGDLDVPDVEAFLHALGAWVHQARG